VRLPDDPPLRVLVCDDSMMFGALIETWVESDARFEHVGSAASGTELLALVDRVPADVLVLDLVLPDVDDIGGLVTAVRERQPDVRILLLSSLTAGELSESAQAAGADGFLHKATTAPKMGDAIAAIVAAG
jgi:DNA-binding NarL/FixJ family response regulator